MFSNSNLEIYQVFPFKNRQKPALISMELMYKIFLKSNLDSFLDLPDEIKRMGTNAVELLDDNFSLANSSLQILHEFQALA
jgi:hypothetical protein